MGFEHHKRPQDFRTAGESDTKLGTVRYPDPVNSTAASTGLAPRGVAQLQTTATGAPVVYTLAAPLTGEEMYLSAGLVASSSVAPFHVNAPSGFFFGTSSEDMMTLSTQGAGAHLVAYSTARLFAVGIRGATFSSST